MPRSIIGSVLTATGLMGCAAVFSWCGMVAFLLGLVMQGVSVVQGASA